MSGFMDWLRDKAHGKQAVELPAALLPTPIDYSAEMRDRLFARLEQFRQQRRDERRQAGPAPQREKPMVKNVNKAKHELYVAREARRERAQEFVQQTINASQLQRQTDAQQERQTERVQHKPRQPRQ
jgi:hypothetical protein